MKIYSDTLTDEDIQRALSRAVNAQPNHIGHCGFETFRPLRRVQLRARGWDVLLYRVGSRRSFNSGRRGAGDQGAARYDDYGLWLAELYRADPRMLVRGQYSYQGADDYHRATQRKFSKAGDSGEVVGETDGCQLVSCTSGYYAVCTQGCAWVSSFERSLDTAEARAIVHDGEPTYRYAHKARATA